MPVTVHVISVNVQSRPAGRSEFFVSVSRLGPTESQTISFLTRFNKIAIQGTPQMAVDKEAICLSRVYSYYPKCNFPLFYV